MSATNRIIYYPRCEAKNRSCSIEAHSQNWAVIVLRSLLPIKAANASVINNSDQITVYLAYLQNHKLLRLRWPSSQSIVHWISAAIDNSVHPNLNLVVVFRTDWDSARWQSQAQHHSCTVHSHTTKIYISSKRFIAPAIHWFINRYSQAMPHHSHRIYL